VRRPYVAEAVARGDWLNQKEGVTTKRQYIIGCLEVLRFAGTGTLLLVG